MLYVLYGFVFGLFIPGIARRFAKFMPATFAGAISQMIVLSKPYKKSPHFPFYRRLRQQFYNRSLLSAVITAAVTYCALTHFGFHGIWFKIIYLWFLLLLAEIDYRMYLLPDILTIPLLLTGLLASVFDMGFIPIQESVIAAFIGYFLPVVVSLLFVWKHKDAFGGGDVKLLCALGAWLGVEALLAVIVVSAVLFIVYALCRHRRTDAYGPAIALGGIIIAFCYF